tara:strand:+ start:662 stop:811 length:150 start_codon:yes stop_codon:yes gene_type:complete
MFDNKTTSLASAGGVRRDVQGDRALVVLVVFVFHIDKAAYSLNYLSSIK